MKKTRAPADKKWNEIRTRQRRLDDIVLDNGDLHLEDMQGNLWWLGFYRGDKRTSFSIRSKSEITVEMQDNDLKASLVEQGQRKSINRDTWKERFEELWGYDENWELPDK